MRTPPVHRAMPSADPSERMLDTDRFSGRRTTLWGLDDPPAEPVPDPEPEPEAKPSDWSPSGFEFGPTGG